MTTETTPSNDAKNVPEEQTAPSTVVAPKTEGAPPSLIAVPIDTTTQGAPVDWQSGDWQISPNTSSPYNGLEVQAVPVYGSTGAVETITATINDYTLIKDGVGTTLVFRLSDITNETSMPLTPQADKTTLSGFMKFRMLQSAPDQANLFVDLTYGLASPSFKNVQGCILQIPLLLNKSKS
jgi:hypothetical protein